MFIMKKSRRNFVTIVLAAVMLCMTMLTSGCNGIGDNRSDEEKIRDRVAEFFEACGNADIDGAIACMDEDSQKICNSIMNIGTKVADNLLGGMMEDAIGTDLGISSSDLLDLAGAIGVPGEPLKLNHIDITYTSNDSADVKCDFTFTDTVSNSGSQTDSMPVKVVRVGDDWYINISDDVQSGLGGLMGNY